MTYDAELADRVRALLHDDLDVTERRMFGGLAFLVNGNMSVTVSGRGGLMVRLDPDDAALRIDGGVVTPFEMRGKPMEGWLRVDPAGVTTDKGLAPWVKLRVAFARSLPPKKKDARPMATKAKAATKSAKSPARSAKRR